MLNSQEQVVLIVNVLSSKLIIKQKLYIFIRLKMNTFAEHILIFILSLEGTSPHRITFTNSFLEMD